MMGGASALPGKRILHAEDNELNAEIAMELLEDMDIHPDRRPDGERLR